MNRFSPNPGPPGAEMGYDMGPNNPGRRLDKRDQRPPPEYYRPMDNPNRYAQGPYNGDDWQNRPYRYGPGFEGPQFPNYPQQQQTGHYNTNRTVQGQHGQTGPKLLSI